MSAHAPTSLSGDEQALLDAFVEELRRDLGPALFAVWLFGSRARGEPARDLDSDVDLLVLVEDASWDGKQQVHAAVDRAGARLGLDDLVLWFSVHVKDPGWLEQRRAIRSFFMAEVDRDKVVFHENDNEPALG